MTGAQRPAVAVLEPATRAAVGTGHAGIAVYDAIHAAIRQWMLSTLGHMHSTNKNRNTR